MDFRIDTNLTMLEAELERFGEKAAGKATARSLNKTATGVRAQASKMARQHLVVKQRDLKPGFKLFKAKPSKARAMVEVSAWPLPLRLFPHKQVAAGVSVKILRQGGRKTVKTAFMAAMGTGHEGVFIRRLQGAVRVGRLPIEETRTKALSQVIEDPKRLRQIADQAEVRYAKELTNQLRLLQER
jgi:hypothetical protein